MLSEETKEKVVHLTGTLPGWCPLEKALMLAELVLSSNANIVVEVGLFGGRSFFPMALALKQQGTGHAYGIEAFSNSVAVETPTDEVNDDWWQKVDMAFVKKAFLDYQIEQALERHVSLIELPSDEAYEAFNCPRFRGLIDLIHIDASHSLEQATRDVVKWSTLLKPGGLLVVDDIAWPGLQIAKSWLSQTHVVIREVVEETGSYGVYRRSRP